MSKRLLFLLTCLFVLTARGADFDTANQLYEEGKFAEAKAAYTRLVDAGTAGANVYYNLANAEYRLGALGAAALGYERVLALNPSHPEAAANLTLVRNKTGAALWPRSWLDQPFPIRSLDVWAITGVIAGWVLVFCLAGIFLNSRRDKAALWLAVVASLLVCSYAGAALWHLAKDQTLAVVLPKQVEVHLAPAASSGSAGSLPAGSEVRILTVRGDWTYCELPREGRGWIGTDALGRVRPVAL